ncbi:hypothetical protein N0V95_004300 [Ascochyta clinopodiicola]|nr:hypothetical protein N0V95_004300 [Ascochyta clinopodiicola]
MPEHMGIYIQFEDHTATILPLSMDLLAYRKRPFVPRPPGEEYKLTASGLGKRLSCWYMAQDKYKRVGPLLELFKGFSLLIGNDAKILQPPTHGSIGVALPKGMKKMSVCQTWGQDMTHKAANGLVRFTDPKVLTKEAKSHELNVDVKGKIHPLGTLDLDEVTVHRPATEKPLPKAPERLIDGVQSCNFAYDCTRTDINGELDLCTILSERMRALIGPNPTLIGLYPSPINIAGMTWKKPSAGPAADDFVRTLELIHTYDVNHQFGIDFEGLPHTRKGLAGIPLQVGLINIRSGKEHKGFFKYENARPSALVSKMAAVVRYR